MNHIFILVKYVEGNLITMPSRLIVHFICTASLYYRKIKKTTNSVSMWQLENSDSRMIPCSEKSEDQDSKMSSPSPESICKQPMKYLSLR